MFGLDATTRAVDNKSFDELFQDITTRLLKVNPRSIDNEIRRCVMDIGKHYRVDNVQLRQFSVDRMATNLLHWWSSGNEIGLSVNLPNDAIPWASSLSLHGDVVRIERLSDMPLLETAGRQLLEVDGLTAVLLVPLDVDEQVYGVLMLGSKQSRQWSDEIVRESQLLGEVLAHAYERAQVHSTDALVARDNIERVEQKYRVLVESTNDAVYLLDGKRIIDCNNKALQVSQRTREELMGFSPWENFPVYQPDGSKSKDRAETIFKDVESGNPQQFEWQQLRPNGAVIDHDISLTPIELTGEGLRILMVARDITDAKQAERETEHRAEFKRLLADMSSSLLRSPIEDTVAQVNEAFADVCARYELDSAGLWWFSGGETVMAKRYAGWRRDPNTASRQPEYQAESPVPWFAAQVLKGNIIQIDDVYDMPDEAGADQKTLLGWGARALLGIPVSAENRIAGCCVFNSAEQRAWDQETIQELGLVGDTITAACSRHRATAEVLRSEQNLARSQQMGRLGNFKFTLDDESRGFPPQGKLEVSPQFCELFDIDTQVPSFEQVIARIHPDDLNRFLSGVKKGMETGVDIQATYRIVRTDGTVIYAEDRSVYEADKTDHTKRIFGTVQDMTDRVEAKQKIESALAEIEKLKDQLQQENIYLREEIRVAHGFNQIIGDSPQLRRALVAAEKVAPTGVPVLILGETGTGKELIAQAIHDLSGRKDKALISVNCAALSTTLIESELFGHEKGAFTGAHSQRKGRFERAHGGTLILDEIGDLPAESQAKLLRVLQTGGFERVGGLETLHVDARLIAATNKNLKRAVDEGEFRADLYYRISSFPIELPPLRERTDDIPALTEFLVAKHAKRMGKDIQSISARTIRYFTNRQWPGNVRELEGVVQRALISTMGPVLDYTESYDVEPECDLSRRATPTVIATDLRTVEREHIVGVLERSGWVISGELGAASMMDIPPSTLRSKMKRLGIARHS